MEVRLKLECKDDMDLDELWKAFYEAKKNLEDYLSEMHLRPEIRE